MTAAGEVIAQLWLPGRPQTKGSMKPYPVRDGRGRMKIVMQDDNPMSKPWRLAAVREIRAAHGITPVKVGNRVTGFTPAPFAGPVEVEFTAWWVRECAEDWELPYPTREKGEYAHGDGDKVERNLWDALVQSGLIADDSNVVTWAGRKRWLDGEAMQPCMDVTVVAA